MTRYWVLGLLVVVVAVLCLLRRLLGSRRPHGSVDIPLEDLVRSRPEVLRVMDDDTAPAVLSPPELRSPSPKKAA